MKNLHFLYEMKIRFSQSVENHCFTLKCTPLSYNRQDIKDLKVEVLPKEFLSTDRDSFGNLCIYGYSKGVHENFSVHVEGMARTGLAAFEPAKEDEALGMYRYQSRFTKPGPALTAFAKTCSFAPEANGYDKAIAYMARLHENFSYVQGVTDIGTTAEEAMEKGQGVCQDYSHILISLCRMEHIPARYVVGMLMGEGLSHAWVEICDKGRWYALDPTNNLVVDDQHIRISVGRDYEDCTINQGVFVGTATQQQEARVLVEEI